MKSCCIAAFSNTEPVLCKWEEEVLETTYITKLYNNTNANIAYTTNSTIREHLKEEETLIHISVTVYISYNIQCVVLCTLKEIVDCLPLDLKDTIMPLRQVKGSQNFLSTFWKKITPSHL